MIFQHEIFTIILLFSLRLLISSSSLFSYSQIFHFHKIKAKFQSACVRMRVSTCARCVLGYKAKYIIPLLALERPYKAP